MIEADLCEKCEVMEGTTVYGSNLVCPKCNRKLKKEERQLKREIYYGRRQRVRQKASPNFHPKRSSRNIKPSGRGK